MNLQYNDDKSEDQYFHNNVDSFRYIISTRNAIKSPLTYNNLSTDKLDQQQKQQQIHRQTVNKRVRKIKKKDPFQLRKLVTENKVKFLVRNFVTKMKRLKTSRNPIDIQKPYDESNQFFKWLKMKQGFKINNFSLIAWTVINIIQLTIMVFVFSIMTAFSKTEQNPGFISIRTISFILYIIDMILNMTIQSFQMGKQVVFLWNICQKYFQKGFIVDAISILLFPITIFSNFQIAPLSLFVTILKLANNIQRFQKLQYLIVSNEKQHYYGLIKVFITNFAIGHFLSILLNLVSQIDPSRSWHTIIGIENSQWFIKYIWGYYWGTNIMLTVGFGDLKANTEAQAIALIFAQIFSCIILAYNISNVGTLITQIRSNSNKRKKQLKTFHRMSKDNQISSQLVTKVNNFIQQSYQIKQQFEFNQYDTLLQELPHQLQSQYRKQSNNYLFDNIGFLSNMSKRTLLYLAEAVIRKIAHPEQIILKKGQNQQFMILQAGQVLMCCRNKSQFLSGKSFDSIVVKEQEKPKIISLDFIKGKKLQYDLVSSGYSILYKLDRQQFTNYLRKIEMDFQFFCTIRDRDQYALGQNQVYFCQICKNQKHNKFQCPRLHFIPFHRHVINKYLFQQKLIKQERKQYYRSKSPMISAYSSWVKRKIIQQSAFRFIKAFLNQKDYEETMRIRRAYKHFISRKQRRQQKLKMQQQRKLGDHTPSLILKRHLSLFPDLSTSQMQTLIEKQNTYTFEFMQKIQSLFLKNKVNYLQQSWNAQIDSVQIYRYYFTTCNIDQITNIYPMSGESQNRIGSLFYQFFSQKNQVQKKY